LTSPALEIDMPTRSSAVSPLIADIEDAADMDIKTIKVVLGGAGLNEATCIGVFKLNGFYYFCHISRVKST
jgi:hypothetical protein